MKRPYTGESWTRFKTLMQKLTKRTAIVETRAQNNEDRIEDLEANFDPVVPPEKGGTGWEHGLNSGINIVPGTSDEWSDWISPTPNTINQAFNIAGTGTFPSDRNVGDVYTCSIEIEFEKVTASSSGQFLVSPQGYVNGTWAGNWFDKNIWYKPSILTAPPEDGVKKFVWFNTMSSEHYTEEDLNTFSLQLRCDYWGSGRFRYRCLKIERGYVDYPQWTPAPEDITAINDMTTGINLIRGSRDFQEGITKSDVTVNGAQNWFTDGFRIVSPGYIKREIDSEGFTVLTIERSGLTSDGWTRIDTSTFEIGGEITVSFDVRINSNIAFDTAQQHIFSSDSTLTFEQVTGVKIAECERDKWYRAIVHIEPKSVRYLVFELQRNGSISFRKICANRGYITNPIYAVNPADLALEPVNDMTTGINLIRGSRDFRQGVQQVWNARYVSDGFNFPTDGNFERVVSDNGFIAAKATLVDASKSRTIDSNLFKVYAGETITVSYELMFEDITEIPTIPTFSTSIWEKAGTKQYTSVVLKEINGTAFKSLEPNKWYLFKATLTIPSFSEDFGYAILSANIPTDMKSSYYIRGFMAQRGSINRPISSPSPLDYASSQVEQSSPYYLGNLPANFILGNGADLNECLIAGHYACKTSAIAQTIKNRPEGMNNAFDLEVRYTQGTDTGAIRQTLTVYFNSAREYIRTKESGTWSDWRETYGNTTVRPIEGGGTGGDSISTAQQGLRIFSPIVSVDMPDLNEINYGYFKWAPTSTNAPSDTVRYGTGFTFSNTVNATPGRSGNWIYQIGITANNNYSGNMYTRSIVNNNNWGSWKRIAYVGEIPYNNGLYDGESIAAKFSAEIGSNHIANWLSSRVSQGNFEGLNIGDYVDIPCGGVTRRYVIAAIDLYYKVGSPTKLEHHIVMVPLYSWSLSTSRDGDYAIGTNSNAIKWNINATNNGTSSQNCPYLASNLHKWETEVAIKQFPQQWQDVMIDRIAYIESRYSASSSALTNMVGRSWVNLGKLWSPSETELCGTSRFSEPTAEGADSQFTLFSKISDIRVGKDGNTSFWMRSIVKGSSAEVCAYGNVGSMSYTNANNGSILAYPCFLLG